ncbi:J domain-containing protein [Legionella gresilensis]|uniref:J domain-containing protein n=1 Tax=Legionella gresilensis TaxID=91823 RepID=UPI0010416636|nr:J domain-containing protein [Legionella gresilensis]
MKDLLNFFDLLKIEPTTELEKINKAYFKQILFTHLKYEDNLDKDFNKEINELNFVFNKLDTQEKLNRYYFVFNFNKSLTRTNEQLNFFKKKPVEIINCYISLPFDEQKSAALFHYDTINLPNKLPSINLDYFIKCLNKLSKSGPIPVGFSEEAIIQIINEHKIHAPQLIVHIIIPSSHLSSNLSEAELYKNLGQCVINASHLSCPWILMDCKFSPSDIREIFAMANKHYKNTTTFNFNWSNSLWPPDYRYSSDEILEINSSPTPL